MNPNPNDPTTPRIRVRAWRYGGYSLGSLWLATGGLGLMDQRAADAQAASFDPNSVLANPAPVLPLQTQDQQSVPNQMAVFQPAGADAGNPLPQIFRFGPLQVHPSLDYSFSYGNGIQSAPGNQQGSIVQTLSPGLLVDLGKLWALSYTPAFQFYSSDQFHNTVDQAFALTGGFAYEDWQLGLSQTAGYSSSPTVATGAQTDQTSYVTALSASHPLTSKISAELGLNQSIALASAYDDSYTWSTMDWLNYTFWSRLNAGIGAGGGYVMVRSDSQVRGVGANNDNQNLDQTYEDLQARVNWRAADKISFQISGGFEDRQFSTADAGDSLSPIFSASIQYLPFKDTQISLSAGSSVSASTLYLAAQQTQTTSVGLNLNQQLFQKFSLGLGAAYAETAYSTAIPGVSATAANRTDDIVSFNARLSHPFFKRGTWSVFYQYSDNTSNQRGYTFASNQMGFEIGYRF